MVNLNFAIAGVTGFMEDLGLKKKKRKNRNSSDSFGLKSPDFEGLGK
jgi:hypothetical protein